MPIHRPAQPKTDDLLGGAWGSGRGSDPGGVGGAARLLSPQAWDASARRLPASWRSPRFTGCSEWVPGGFPAAAPPKEAWVVSRTFLLGPCSQRRLVAHLPLRQQPGRSGGGH